jgi:hypothetical protein
MERILVKIFSVTLGLITTFVSKYIEIGEGDVILSGFPLPYRIGTWGRGYEWQFIWVFALINLLIWSAIWFILIKILVRIRKRYIA